MSGDNDPADDGTDTERIQVGETADGEPVSIPAIQLLTGRGFVTGKSGSGKSNTASVVAEELLERQFPLLVVDTDGEYYGLKEEYELLHAGADEECDIQVRVEHAEKLATLALDQNVPIILDVSGYLDEGVANELLRETVRHLFAKEKKLKKPFLLVVEECHEYIPEGGGMDETGKLLIKVGKRGRKHGLGILGISQRPADVKKDFITQANWLVWHRLTWENDTKVVGRIVGGEYGAKISKLAAGEAFVQTDWTDDGVRRVQFKRKRTFDAGATPGLDDFERPELKSVSDALMDDLASITEREEREADRVAQLESQLERKQERIAELEAELETARDVSAAARKMANAFAHGDPLGGGVQTTFEASGDDDGEVARLRERVAELESALDDLDDRAASPLADDDPTISDGEPTDAQPTDVDVDADAGDSVTTDDSTAGEGSAADAGVASVRENGAPADERTVEEYLAHLRRRGERALGQRDDGDGAEVWDADEHREPIPEIPLADVDVAALLGTDPVAVRIAAARRQSKCNRAHAERVLDELASSGPATAHDLADAATVSVEAAHSLLSELRARDLVTRDADRRYEFDADRLRDVVAADDGKAHLGELREQWRMD